MMTAEIRSETVANVLTVPKEAIRTNDRGESGVYVLNGQQIAWKPVKTGVANVTRQQVDGLDENTAVEVYSDKTLHDGMIVKAVFPERL